MGHYGHVCLLKSYIYIYLKLNDKNFEKFVGNKINQMIIV